MKKALVTFIDYNFQVGFLVLLKSLLMHNKLELPFIILHDGSITKPFKIYAKELYDKIEFLEVNEEPYKVIQIENSPKQYLKNYFKYDLFKLYNYDYLVFLDSDILCFGEISYLLNLETNSNFQKFNFAVALDEHQISAGERGFNSGVMVIGKKNINEEVFKDLIEASIPGNFDFADQNVLNEYFKNKYSVLPSWYNCLKTYYRFTGSWLSRVKFLHYVSKKPWNRFSDNIYYLGNRETIILEKFWWKVFDKLDHNKLENIQDNIQRED